MLPGIDFPKSLHYNDIVTKTATKINPKIEKRWKKVKANQDIRNAVAVHGFKLWELAEALGVNDGNLSRKLRRELPNDQKEHIFRTIDRMVEARKEM